MKNTIILILMLGIFAWTNSAFTLTDGTETRNVDNFSIVDVSSGIQVTLVHSSDTKVEIETKNCEPSDVKTVVENNRLIIKYKKNKWGSGKRKAYVTVYYSSLEGIEASSGSNVRGEDAIESEDMDIEASSGASINLELECEELSVDISSGASVRLGGECSEQEIEVSSGASYRADELVSEVADISASSGGSAKIWVSKKLEADASSGGSVKYKGDPSTTDIDKGYSGSVKKI